MNSNLTQKFGAMGILTVLLTVAMGQGMVKADSPGEHPHYLHARSDLRKAEQLLRLPDERNVKQEEDIAARELHAAIWEIDRASVLDRKDVDDNPPIDTSLNHQGKFHEIERLLQRAKRDISLEEDNHSAIGWRHKASVHITEAERRVEIAARRDRADDLHQQGR